MKSGFSEAPAKLIEVEPRQMTEAEILAAAEADEDALPWDEAALRAAARIPAAKVIRRALDLSQEAFAARFQIPLGTLRAWEQGVSVPDKTAQAYLKAIAGEAAALARALAAG
jgi:putative transcriptional regulator